MDSTDRTWEHADAYEAFMGRWSRPLAREFLKWLDPAPTAHWLEVGCGTGALTTAICELGEPASVVGSDPSGSFLEAARRALPDPRATFVEAPAEHLPTRPEGFDRVVSGLVLNFLPDPARVASDVRQRLRDGGIFAAYVWDYSGGMEFLRAFWEEAVAEDPEAAARAENLGFSLCHPSALTALLENAGFSDAQTGALEIPTVFSSFDDYWQPFLLGTGTGPSFVASLAPDHRERLRARLELRLTPSPGESIELKARAWAVRGSAS